MPLLCVKPPLYVMGECQRVVPVQVPFFCRRMCHTQELTVCTDLCQVVQESEDNLCAPGVVDVSHTVIQNKLYFRWVLKI